MTDDAAGLVAKVRDVLASLADGDALVLTAPPSPDTAPRRRWRRPRTVSPYVQFLRLETDLLGECAGPERLGGPLALDPSAEAALAGLGWLFPGDPALDPALARAGNLVRVWSATDPWPSGLDVDAAAELAVTTLGDVFDVRPADVVVDRL